MGIFKNKKTNEDKLSQIYQNENSNTNIDSNQIDLNNKI